MIGKMTTSSSRLNLRQLGLAAWLVPALATFTVPARAVSSAEFYQSPAEFYGRFEARIQFAPADGVVSSFFLWKAGSDTSGAYWNELDFEKLGADCHVQTNAIFGAPSVGHPQTNAITGDACGEYHTYGFEWAPSYISWQIDGAEVRRDAAATATAFAQNASSGMQIHFNIWPGDASFGGNFNPLSLPVHQYISWVQYSSFDNGSFTLKWRENFDLASVPSGWATGNWASPKNLSTHSPANVNFVAGISILSLTSDNATGFTGMPPGDGVLGSSGAGGSGNSGAAGSGGAAAGLGGQNTGASGTAGLGGQSSGGAGAAGVPTTGSGGNHSGGNGGAGPSAGDPGFGNGALGGASAAGTAGARDATASGSSGGCGCHLPMAGRTSGAAGGVALAALLFLARRRRWARL
jgi:endo-1,3-1,4-beta-glycanase ExoK